MSNDGTNHQGMRTPDGHVVSDATSEHGLRTLVVERLGGYPSLTDWESLIPETAVERSHNYTERMKNGFFIGALTLYWKEQTAP